MLKSKIAITQDILSVAEDKSLEHTGKISRINEILKQLMDEQEEEPPKQMLEGFGIKEEEEEERKF